MVEGNRDVEIGTKFQWKCRFESPIFFYAYTRIGWFLFEKSRLFTIFFPHSFVHLFLFAIYNLLYSFVHCQFVYLYMLLRMVVNWVRLLYEWDKNKLLSTETSLRAKEKEKKTEYSSTQPIITRYEEANKGKKIKTHTHLCLLNDKKPHG